MRVMTRLIAVAAAVAVVSPSLGAQKAERTSGPEKGTWGAEAGVGGLESASLVRFQSAQWALIVGGSVQTIRNKDNNSGNTSTFSSASLRVGARRYGGSGLGLRPIVGLGATARNATGNSAQFGAYGEFGAAYFFTPHLSLGATGDLAFTGGKNVSSLSASIAHLTASVFF